ncbi:pyridoxamine 5'-phosphate oxidase family protein [Bdellovibrio sp. NC01]|uniref:pyridoxamine 5'-phosphate oxidase family protein n=1 Tax=Bdellovibrio sp. NC01 TaxID=2220073 RepID=UPI0011578AB9|nr:pyridoxamine 5'-phosphate oxidase family protein [Bdellovibrio sp. NC01]QDK38109.1 hypothetical protein DOE51_11185 [Bdellovibrio sp. NC01]
MDNKSQHSSDPEIRKLGELIKDVKVAMLTTKCADNTLHCSPLMTQQVDFDGDLWFIIAKDSHKVKDISGDDHVNLSYSNAHGTYVSVTGTAELVDDKEKVHQLWSKFYQAYFPQGELDPNIQLLRINVDKAEYWDSPSNPIAKILEFTRLATGKPTKMGEHGTLNLNH